MVRPVRSVHLYYDRAARKWYADARTGAGVSKERQGRENKGDALEQAKLLCDKYPRADFIK